jgi:hypothetical protein
MSNLFLDRYVDPQNILGLNVHKCKLEDVKNYTLYTSRPDLILKSTKSIREEVDVFNSSEKDNKDKWSFEDFNYRFSKLGFRDVEIPDSIDIAIFGCSFTFGVGLPAEKLWHKILSEKNNVSCYNFAMPGASIEHVIKIFYIVSRYVKIKKAIFLLPDYARQLMAVQHLSTLKVDLLDLVPNMHDYIRAEYGFYQKIYYKTLPDAELIRRSKDDLYSLEHIAQSKNIELYLSSWHRPTYHILENMTFDYATVLKEWIMGKPEMSTDLARDKMHPGLEHHKYWAEQIENQVFK